MRDFVLRNLWLKLFSLLIAMLIWLAVQGYQAKEAPMVARPVRADDARLFEGLPVLVMSDPSGPRWRSEPSRVSVRVFGSANVLPHIQPSELQLFVRAGVDRASAGPRPVEWHPISGVARVQIVPPVVTLRPAEGP